MVDNVMTYAELAVRLNQMERAGDTDRRRAFLNQFVAEFGTETQQACHRAGWVSDSELFHELAECVFQPFTDGYPLADFEPHAAEEACDRVQLTADEYDHLVTARTLAQMMPGDVSVAPCALAGSKQAYALVTVRLAGGTIMLNRRYPL